VLVLMAVTAFCWRGSPVGLIVASLMCGGDGLADIVGRRLGGGNPLPWNREKSWAGSAAMFGGGLGMSLGLIALFCLLGYLECELPATALTGGCCL
jgi:phytol kinase